MPNIETRVLEEDLRRLIAEIIEIEPEKVTIDARFVDDLGMDSMMALEILAAMEKKYKIQIPESKLSQLRNLRDTLKLTEEYLNKT